MYENYSVLFVDDEENILSSIRRGLMDEEYTCHFAKSGKEAIELMTKHKIDVIVSDMRMPEMNGLELLKVISEKWPMTVKIVLSGYTQLQQILVTINQIDIFKFLTKPWNLEELIVIINKSLDYYIIQEENASYKKVLETKNQAYQNILKKVDEVINNAKKSSEILGMCGKAILGFGKNYDISQKEKYKHIFYMQDEIFDIFSKAVTNEKKQYDNNELADYISAEILLKKPYAKIEKKSIEPCKFNANVKMLEATISSILIIFEEEFKECGMFINIGAEKGKKLLISIVSPNADSNNEADEKTGLTILDIKLEFIKSVVETAMKMCQISFQGAKVNGSLVLGINLDE